MKERELCTNCGGNGVLKIPGGVSQCDRCHGEGWDPGEPSIPVSQLRALSEQWNRRARSLDGDRFDRLKGKAFDECAADLDHLLEGETEP